MNTLFILDVSAYLFRSYYAIKEMSNTKGEATNALFGFIRSIYKLRSDFSPTHMVAVFDPPDGKETRTAIYKEYKAHRKTIPEDLPHQIQWAKEFCNLYGLPLLETPKIEADDTIASVAVWAKNNNFHSFICSSDKDLCQIVDDKIHVLHTHKNNKILTPKEVYESYGVHPNQIIDYLSITGDSADNVPGITGFGPKTAVKLLNEFSTLENIFNNSDKIVGKKQQTLLKEVNIAKLSKQLVTLDLAIPIPTNPEFYTLKQHNTEQLISFYKEKTFTSFLKELSPSPIPHAKTDYELINTKSTLETLVKQLSSATEIALYLETSSQHPLKSQIIGISFCIETGKGSYIPCNAGLSQKEVLLTLKPVFENPHLSFFGHNIKQIKHTLKNYSIELTNCSFDTILASSLLTPETHNHSLNHLSLHYFNKEKISVESLIGKGKKAITIDLAPIDKLTEYCCENVELIFQLKKELLNELKKRTLTHLLYTIELPTQEILFQMERHGIYVDPILLKTHSKKIVIMLEALKNEIYSLAEETFTINSPKQLSKILFEKLGISPPKKTATGYSTNAEVLETLKANYPIAEKILKYRQLEKLRSTYLDPLPNEINPKTQRIHSTFTQYVTATGRLSSQHPNLQNIPIRTEEGRLIRAAFQPQNKNWSFLSADYSQIELRLLAHMSEDPELIKAFQNKEDIHSYTASLIFNTSIENVTKEQRYQAKTVNFGIIYGQQAFGLAKELKIDRKTAAEFIDTYFQRYPKVKEFIRKCHEQTRLSQKTVTLSGRERSIPDINSKNKNISSLAERLAVNSPIQGSAADLIKLAMISVNKRIKEASPPLKGFMLLQIHDELIFEIPDEEIEQFKHLVTQGMVIDTWKLKIPSEINITIGKNWKEC